MVPHLLYISMCRDAKPVEPISNRSLLLSPFGVNTLATLVSFGHLQDSTTVRQLLLVLAQPEFVTVRVTHYVPPVVKLWYGLKESLVVLSAKSQ